MRTNIREFLDKLLDEENWETLELENSRGEIAYFDQICVLPESDSTYYAILQPVDAQGDEIDDPMVFVFTNADTDDVNIDIVTDQYVIREVFDEYRLLRRADTEDDDDEEYDFDEEDELISLDELDDSDETDSLDEV